MAEAELEHELQQEREHIRQLKNALRHSELDAWKYKASFALEEERTRIIKESAVTEILACVVKINAAENASIRKGELLEQAEIWNAACDKEYGELLQRFESMKEASQQLEARESELRSELLASQNCDLLSSMQGTVNLERIARHDAQELRSSLSSASSVRNEKVTAKRSVELYN